MVLVGMNKRDKKVFDMHRIDLATGEEKLDTENPGNVVGWTADDGPRSSAAATTMNPDGSYDLLVRDDAGKPSSAS